MGVGGGSRGALTVRGGGKDCFGFCEGLKDSMGGSGKTMGVVRVSEV